jgi:DNA-binding winged helix-turn-helix (wHTH) protein
LLYRFADLELDTDRRELRRGPHMVAIAPQVFDLLEYLIKNRHRVVSKDDLIGAIWHGRIVSETAVSTRINVLRSAIDDTGEDQRFIRTLPRKGVRFVGIVHEAQEPETRVVAEAAERPTPALTFPDRPSISVPPFTNMSDDPRQGTPDHGFLQLKNLEKSIRAYSVNQEANERERSRHRAGVDLRGSTKPQSPAGVPSATGPVFAASNIPIRVPMHFMGRDDALAAIGAALACNEGRVAITALHGLRGVGKTTLAAAYAERHRNEYRATWWIRAQTEAGMRADLVALGVRLGWAAADDKEESALAAVAERLRHESEGVLLIFDNAIDADELKPLSTARWRGARSCHLECPCMARSSRACRNPAMVQGDRRRFSGCSRWPRE